MKVRNKLLNNIRENLAVIDELNYWDEQILNFGADIIYQRNNLIKSYNDLITSIYKKISGENHTLKIKYECKAKEYSKENIRNELRELFEISKLEDINYGQTSIGPHRDDLVFLLDGKDIRTFGSRGEIRSIILSLKIAELEYIEKNTDKKPILLLDDVLSELDNNRRTKLLEFIKGYQVILTTTDKSHLINIDKENLNTIEL